MSCVAFRKGLEGLGGLLGGLGGLCKRQQCLPPLGGLLGASWGPLGSLLEHEPPAWGIVEVIGMIVKFSSCRLYGASGSIRKPSGKPLECLLGSLGRLEDFRKPLGSLLGPLGSVLGPSWGSLGPRVGFIWGPLGANFGRHNTSRSLRWPTWCPLGTSWGPLGSLTEGARGPHGGPSGASWGLHSPPRWREH